MQSVQAAIPSPTVSVVKLGPLSIHYYALCIIAGIIVCLWLTGRRWQARGGEANQISDVAIWAILFGIVGGRLYHVITDPSNYFGHGGDPVAALKIWDGGLGIWGAIALGALGAYIGARRHNVDFTAFADVAAPGIILAQAFGRWGNWFNNELYGRPTSLPWKLEIHDLDVVTGKAATDSSGHAIVIGYFQPTFLYESLWCLLIFGLLIWADRRFRLGGGNVFALYVMGYTFGRFWFEMLRSDYANRFLGMRVNDWASIIVFLGGLVWLLRHRNDPRSRAAGPKADGEPDAADPRPDGDAAVGTDAVVDTDTSA